MARFHILRTAIPNAGRVIGDVSSIVADDHGWGRYGTRSAWLAAHPNLMIIDCPELPLDVANRMYQRWMRAAIIGESEAQHKRPIVELGPHRWTFRITTALPGNITKRDQLLSTGEVVLSRAEFNSWVNDRAGLDVPDTKTPIDPVIPRRQIDIRNG